MSGLGIFGMGLLGLPVLIAQWCGVVLLAKVKRNGAWWTMLIGTALSTLSIFGTALGMAFLMNGMGSGGSSSMTGLLSLSIVSTGGGLLGGLMFAIGFAVHAARCGRLVQRTAELEQLSQAMAEELNRAGGRPG